MEIWREKGFFFSFWEPKRSFDRLCPCILPAEHVKCDMNDTSESDTTTTTTNQFKCAMILYLVISILFTNTCRFARVLMCVCLLRARRESVEHLIVVSCVLWEFAFEQEKRRPIKFEEQLLIMLFFICIVYIERKSFLVVGKTCR